MIHTMKHMKGSSVIDEKSEMLGKIYARLVVNSCGSQRSGWRADPRLSLRYASISYSRAFGALCSANANHEIWRILADISADFG